MSTAVGQRRYAIAMAASRSLTWSLSKMFSRGRLQLPRIDAEVDSRPLGFRRISPAQSHTRRRVSRSRLSVQARKLSSSHLVDQRKPSTAEAVNVSARLPEKVSTRQRRYSLRHGASRWPRVAFQMKRSGASNGWVPLASSIEVCLALNHAEAASRPDLLEQIVLARSELRNHVFERGLLCLIERELRGNTGHICLH